MSVFYYFSLVLPLCAALLPGSSVTLLPDRPGPLPLLSSCPSALMLCCRTLLLSVTSMLCCLTHDLSAAPPFPP